MVFLFKSLPLNFNWQERQNSLDSLKSAGEMETDPTEIDFSDHSILGRVCVFFPLSTLQVIILLRKRYGPGSSWRSDFGKMERH